MWQQRTYVPAAKEVQQTARAVIQVLAEHDFKCCLIGSMAAAIYGAVNRNPRDVDIVILNANSSPSSDENSQTEIGLEEIKQLIAENSSSDFYLVPSKDPSATYQILYYILTPSYPDPSHSLHRACKVDLLLPGSIGIPLHIPQALIHYDEYFPDIPLIPFLVLLCLKVRAWSEHRVDRRVRMRDKVKYDEGDIKELLDLGVNEYTVRVRKLERWVGEAWIDDMRTYVKEYAESKPRTRAMWEEMGFVVNEWGLAPE